MPIAQIELYKCETCGKSIRYRGRCLACNLLFRRKKILPDEQTAKIAKERDAERHFRDWLDKKSIPYLYIDQDAKSFSEALKKQFTRRPDFLILVQHIGFILTDVEYKEPAELYECFQIDYEETQKYLELQRKYNLNVWYVFGSLKDHFTTWHWIPVSKMLEQAKKHSRKSDGHPYLAIPITACIQLSAQDEISKLFSF